MLLAIAGAVCSRSLKEEASNAAWKAECSIMLTFEDRLDAARGPSENPTEASTLSRWPRRTLRHHVRAAFEPRRRKGETVGIVASHCPFQARQSAAL